MLAALDAEVQPVMNKLGATGCSVCDDAFTTHRERFPRNGSPGVGVPLVLFVQKAPVP
jgi:hypothetical protein